MKHLVHVSPVQCWILPWENSPIPVIIFPNFSPRETGGGGGGGALRHHNAESTQEEKTPEPEIWDYNKKVVIKSLYSIPHMEESVTDTPVVYQPRLSPDASLMFGRKGLE